MNPDKHKHYRPVNPPETETPAALIAAVVNVETNEFTKHLARRVPVWRSRPANARGS